jgi:hypothetical protein
LTEDEPVKDEEP